MKKLLTAQIVGALLALTPFLCDPIATFADDGAREYYVSVDGNDSNSGASETDALKTLERARDLIRAQRASGASGEFVVRLGAGEFVRTATFQLTAEDAHTRYVGTAGKTVVSAGVDIKDWKIATSDQKKRFPNADETIWVAKLPQVAGATFYFEQLFVGENRAIRARFPNEGFLRPESVWQDGSIQKPAKENGVAQAIIAKKGDLDALDLANIKASELRFAQFVVHHHWDTTRRILLGYDQATRALKAQGAPMKHWNPWRDTSMYYLENLRTAFDAPGEWFYAGDEGLVYYRPRKGENIETTRFVAPYPGVRRLLTIGGKDANGKSTDVDIRFENIRFVYSDAPRDRNVMASAALDESITGSLDLPGPSQFEPAQAAFFTTCAIWLENCQKVVFADCDVAHIGEYGIGMRDCSDCEVLRTDFTDLGAGAVRIGGGKMDVRNKVEDCRLTCGGRFFASAVGVWIGQNTEEIEILHNDIIDFYYTGVSVGWVWGYNGGHAFRNRIEFNRIGRIGQGAMSDMGGVYTLGTSIGTRVCNNVVFDVSSYAYGGWGLYPDEGSEGILFENNLVYDTTDGSFHQHYGKENVIRNNILARSRTNPAHAGAAPHQLAVTRVEEHLSDTIENNIIYWKEGVAFGYSADRAKVIYRNNLWFNAGGEATFSGKSYEDWQKETGKDLGGKVADPLFVDPDSNDFHLKPNSPALEMGFKPFEYLEAGARR